MHEESLVHGRVLLTLSSHIGCLCGFLNIK